MPNGHRGFLVRLTGALAMLAAARFVVPEALHAQEAPTGRIVGRILDAQTGAGLTDVGIQVVGTTLGAMSGIEGRFTVAGIPAGTVTLHVRRIGYQPKTVTGIVVSAGETVEQSVTLETAAVTLTAQVVTASVERGTVGSALDAQRTATGIVNAVSAEQISKSPDGDAAQAVQRVSGVTVQDGRYVFVRGLGERYTTTSLNGARLPSPEPERKVVPLDLFPAGLLQTITTAKTFTPDRPGDFSGAQVDIRTREFPAERTMAYSMSAGYNTAATAKEVLAAPTVGQEWLGLAGGDRSLPGLAAGTDLGSASQQELNALVGSFRNAWSPVTERGSPNGSMSFSIGGEDPVLGQQVGYLGSLTYSYSQEVRANELTARALASGSGIEPFSEYRGSTGRTSVLWGGLLNLSTFIGGHSKISLNNTFNQSGDNEAVIDEGEDEQFAVEARRMTQRFIERSVRSHQLRLEHLLGPAQQIDWGVTYSSVTRDEPDRSDIVYAREAGATTPFAWLSYVPEYTRRSFSSLEESALDADASWRLALGPVAQQSAIKVGAAYRLVDRASAVRPYEILSFTLDEGSRQQRPELIFGSQYTGPDDRVFDQVRLTRGGDYTAEDRVAAGYAMVEYQVTPRLRVIGGARYERQELEVRSEPTVGANDTTVTREYDDVLPSLILNYALTDWQNLRVSATQTLARPEYREISPLPVIDRPGEPIFTGNPELERTLIQNYDVRWEWYPNAGELVSVAVFAKRFDEPIERVEIATTGRNELGVANAVEAWNYGLEVELRKELGALAEPLSPFSVFANGTLMRSRIDLGENNAALTNETRAMVGQSPYVLNTGLTYVSESARTSATMLYNVVGERIARAGTRPYPDVYEQERHVLDFSLQFPVAWNVTGRFDARNLLDAPVELTQGDVVRHRYETGRVFSVGLSWRP